MRGYADCSIHNRRTETKTAQEQLVDMLQQQVSALQKELENFKNPKASYVEIHDKNGKVEATYNNAGITFRMRGETIELLIFNH